MPCMSKGRLSLTISVSELINKLYLQTRYRVGRYTFSFYQSFGASFQISNQIHQVGGLFLFISVSHLVNKFQTRCNLGKFSLFLTVFRSFLTFFKTDSIQVHSSFNNVFGPCLQNFKYDTNLGRRALSYNQCFGTCYQITTQMSCQ